MNKELFFSIIIPAHNEEKYIQSTLKYLQNLEYPNDAYEIVVIENGSSDTTFERAKEYPAENLKVFSIPEAGVSRARNYGAEKARADADWAFFLDADTFPEPQFLRSLSNFLKHSTVKAYAAGTVELQPYPKGFFVNIIYFFTNLAFKAKGAAYGGALLVRRSLLETEKFDEDLSVGEDETFAKRLRSHGPFFFFSTHLVHTSTRRYQNGGWKKIPVWVGMWIFAIMIPHHADYLASIQRRFTYKVVR